MEGIEIVERFVTFMPNRGHKAAAMFNALVDFLNQNNLHVQDCRGQSYDNASAMSRKYNGLQALVRKENNLAIWLPCTGHSLNLVGKTAAECCSAAVSFFSVLEEVYVFSTSSTHRYQILLGKLLSSATPLYMPKKLPETRYIYINND